MGARGTERVEGAYRGKAALLERFAAQMRATARRYSANGHDADDAFQRAAEILLTHHPTGSDDELCRWLRTVVKHEALAIRRARDRFVPFGRPECVPEPREAEPDTHERAERLERLRVGAQALRRLKPQEIRCLTLRAEGYSYREICERTGWTYTKVNRCLTEGRRAFLERLSGIESGAECERLAPLLSALADSEAPRGELAAARRHLKGCAACRVRLAEFRTAPARVAALAPPAVAATQHGGGSARAWLESLLGAAQHKAAVAGERLHAATEVATGHKAAAVAASAAALAGGGVSVERAHEHEAAARDPKPAHRVEKRPEPVVTPVAPQTAKSSPTQPTPPAPSPQPPPPPPDPAREFAPAAAAAAPSSPTGAGGGGSLGGGEFGP